MMRKPLGTRSSGFTSSAKCGVKHSVFFPYRAAWPSLALLFFLGGISLFWDALNFDNAVSSYWGNAAGFPLKVDEFWGVAVYKAQRLLGWVCMALLVWMVCKPPSFATSFQRMPPQRRWFMLAGVIAASLLIQWLKWRSLTSCPWDYQIFGGIAQDISHWRFGQHDGGPGRCFPAGHPSAGFAFLAVPVFLSLHSRRQAIWLAVAAMSVGGLLGLTQITRGAHFVSHVLWSAWWCAAAACVMLLICLAWEQHGVRQRSAASNSD